ncbi:hypothetical protein PHMEG_00011005 [Phytophthora megakarya]|uniref:Uncharacterized protein n=1 Tax=Phytophthora megakarya TaxID=4795 RepID=A0A225WCL4_9STRA|nr:hypothetical protein PHMEG_00011005 [Phytophthora megakarya]
MLAYKSNHDIQVLIGGLETLLRIYYTTKYVTKKQSLVDSVTAVALAAFKRRELREQQNQTSQTDHSIVGRRRVASVVLAVTNRREIAAPLAVLYLLRGSCCYMSASFTTPPLYDILRELIQNNTHSCNLVEVRDDHSNIKFRAASFLDDYLYRPESLDRKCLYEFVMTCFRRKQSGSTATLDSVLTGHPLYSTHCIGRHQYKAVPVITVELVAKRTQFALVLFKPFRNVLDVVRDPESECAWSDAYLPAWSDVNLQSENTRTGFVREIMTNMDDYYRTSKQAQEDEKSANIELDHERSSDELLGTRNSIDSVIGSIPGESDVPDTGGRTDNFCNVFTADGDETMSDDGSTLPVFPTAKLSSVPSVFHRELLDSAAESTVRVAINLGNHDHMLELSVGELQEWVNNSEIDEAEASPSSQSRNEHPDDVIELV